MEKNRAPLLFISGPRPKSKKDIFKSPKQGAEELNLTVIPADYISPCKSILFEFLFESRNIVNSLPMPTP